MIEPLRFNKEIYLPHEIPRLACCNNCLLDKVLKVNPRVAVRYCGTCPTSLGVDKKPGALLCKECDYKNHKIPENRHHIRHIVVVGPGLRKKVLIRGDGYNFPYPLDKVHIKMKAKIFHNGKRIDRLQSTDLQFISGLSGKSLHIQVLGARNLIASDILGSSDPYVIYSFCGVPLETTRVQPRTTNPRWKNETFIVPMEEHLGYPRNMPWSKKDMVRLEVYDYDVFTSSDFLGHVEVTRSKLEKMALIANEKPIRLPLTRKESNGLVHIQVGYDEEFLLIKIIMADDLNKVDSYKLANPYGKVFLGQSTLIGTTNVIPSTVNPRWLKNNVFKIPIQQALYAEKYINSQIEAFKATDWRFQHSKDIESLLDDFAYLPTKLAYFRIELFDKLSFLEDRLLGKAFISISKIRNIIPGFPNEIKDLDEYNKYVENIVLQDQIFHARENAKHQSCHQLLPCCFKTNMINNENNNQKVNTNNIHNSSHSNILKQSKTGSYQDRTRRRMNIISTNNSNNNFQNTGESIMNREKYALLEYGSFSDLRPMEDEDMDNDENLPTSPHSLLDENDQTDDLAQIDDSVSLNTLPTRVPEENILPSVILSIDSINKDINRNDNANLDRSDVNSLIDNTVLHQDFDESSIATATSNVFLIGQGDEIINPSQIPSVNENIDASQRPSVNENIDASQIPSANENIDASQRPSVNENIDTSQRPSANESIDASQRPSANENIDTSQRPSANENIDASQRPSVNEIIDASQRPSVNEIIIVSSRKSSKNENVEASSRKSSKNENVEIPSRKLSVNENTDNHVDDQLPKVRAYRPPPPSLNTTSPPSNTSENNKNVSSLSHIQSSEGPLLLEVTEQTHAQLINDMKINDVQTDEADNNVERNEEIINNDDKINEVDKNSDEMDGSKDVDDINEAGEENDDADKEEEEEEEEEESDKDDKSNEENAEENSSEEDDDADENDQINIADTTNTAKKNLIFDLFSTRKKIDNTNWSDIYPFELSLDNKIVKNVQGYLVLRLIISSRGSVILGIDEATRQMTIGETAMVKCRYDYAYNSYSMGSSIPPRANMIFTIKLLEINGKGRFNVLGRVFIRFMRNFKRLKNFLLKYCSKDIDNKTTVSKKKQKKKRKNKSLFTRFCSCFIQKKTKTDDEIDKDSDSDFSDDDDDDSDDQAELLARYNGNVIDEDPMSSDDDSSEESEQVIGARPRLKPHPRIRKHLNNSVQTGAVYMWNYKVPPLPEHKKKKKEKKKKLKDLNIDDNNNNQDQLLLDNEGNMLLLEEHPDENQENQE